MFIVCARNEYDTNEDMENKKEFKPEKKTNEINKY